MSLPELRLLISQLPRAEQAELLLGVNPGRLLADEAPLPVPPVATQPHHVPWWRKMLGN